MPFFVIRQTALRRLAYSTSTHKPLPNLRYSIPSFNARRNTSLKPTTSITYSPYLCRYYTTPRPSSSTEVKTDSEPPLPPAKPRKPKVDLRPGPVKPTSVGPTDSTPRPPKTVAPTEEPQPSTSASTAREPALSGTQPDAQTSPTNHIPDAIKEAMAHIQRATQEGVLLPPPENASRFGRLYHQAKELFKFYFRGLKALWTHRGMVAEIRNRVKQEGGLAMTRWESQFVRTYKRDLKKLVPFVAILIILEEILPLVVLYAPFLLPSTCILPSQRERIYQKAEEKKLESIVTAKWAFGVLNLEAEGENVEVKPNSEKKAIQPVAPEALDSEVAWAMCRVLSLSDRGPRSMVNRRLRGHLQYLAEDDALLSREGGDHLLTESELKTAVSERGFPTSKLSDVELRSTLRRWLEDAKGEDKTLAVVMQHVLDYEPPSLQSPQ